MAAAAGVDPRLVLHYFGSKQELFKASIELPLDPEVIVLRVFRDGPDRLGANVAELLVEVLDDPQRRQPLLGLLRAAITEPEAAPLIRELLVERLLGPVARQVGGDEPELRAGLVASQIVGLELARYVVGLPPLVSVASDRLARILGPVIQGYLTGPLPAAVAEPPPMASRPRPDRAREPA